MKAFSGPSALIAFGFVLGVVIGALVVGPTVPPLKDKAWLETYGSALGALMTGVAAFVVVWQILSSERHHRDVLQADYRRAVDHWERTDGNIGAVGKSWWDQLKKRGAAIEELNSNRHDKFFRFPVWCLEPLNFGSTQILTEGASPRTADIYTATLETVISYNEVANEIFQASEENKFIECGEYIWNQYWVAHNKAFIFVRRLTHMAESYKPTLTAGPVEFPP